MTTATLPTPGRISARLRNGLAVLMTAISIVVPEVQKHARPVVGHIREHAYGIIGLGCIDAAAFVHSTFTGLLVTGVSFLVFEWKVRD